MTVIGITGPTGAGKTTVLKEIEALGGAVIDCDAVYHEMLESDRSLQESLGEGFGPLRDGQGPLTEKAGAHGVRGPGQAGAAERHARGRCSAVPADGQREQVPGHRA